MDKIWKAIPGFAGLYEISNYGELVRVATHGLHPKPVRRELKPHKKPNGYLAADLQKDGIRYRDYVHRLVWKAFRGEIPIGLEINHRDGIRANNRLDNFELVTRSDNMLHCFNSLTPSLNRIMGETHHKAKLTEDEARTVLALKGKRSSQALADQYGVSKTAIQLIWKGKNWKQLQN